MIMSIKFSAFFFALVIFTNLASAETDSDSPVRQGTVLHFIGFGGNPHDPDRGHETFITFLEVGEKFVTQSETNPDVGQRLIRTMSAEALKTSKTRYSSYYEGGPDISDSFTSVEVSQQVLRELKEAGQSILEMRSYSVNSQGARTLSGGKGVIRKLGSQSAKLEIDGRVLDVDVVTAEYKGRNSGQYNGSAFQNDLTARLTILDSVHPIIVAGDFEWFRGSSKVANWNSRLVGYFSEDGIRENLEEGLSKGEAVNLAGIRFPFGSDQMLQTSIPFVDAVAEVLTSNQELRVTLSGFTDYIGSESSNKRLSERRAKTVVLALEARGIDASRMIYSGRGEEIAVQNGTYEERARDRRVEISRQ